MKRKISFVLGLTTLLASLAACGGGTTEPSGTVTTGQADGYGGVVTATVTVDDGKLVDVSFEGADETPEVGGEALVALATAMKEAGSEDVDAISGATVTSEAAIYAVKNALNPTDYPYPAAEENTEEGGADVEPLDFQVPSTDVTLPASIESGLRMGQALYAAHGTSSFALTTVVLDGDVVVAAYIDEFQFMDVELGVPNSDSAFGENYAVDTVLGSKRENNDFYSENMTSHGGSTVSYLDNVQAIESYVAGQSVYDLLSFVEGNDAEAVIDAVSGATLADTSGYILSVLAAAVDAADRAPASYDGSTDGLTLKRSLGVANSDSAFTVSAVLTDGTNIVLAYIDEFQCNDAAADIVAVPNSNESFGENFVYGKVLISKRYNNETYSANMSAYSDSTVSIADNFDYIEAYVSGKTIDEIETLASGDEEAAIDAVTGATLTSTPGYLNAIVQAAKA